MTARRVLVTFDSGSSGAFDRRAVRGVASAEIWITGASGVRREGHARRVRGREAQERRRTDGCQ
jgi:hypothetical protein